LALSKDAVGHAKRERGRLHEPCFELAFELVVHRYDAAGQPVDKFMHVVSLQPDAAAHVPVQRTS
jgi:hypothetical protein